MPQSTPKAHRAEQDGYFAHATLATENAPQIATPFTLTAAQKK